MLTSSALVLFMTAPGLAMFYCGLVRKKNVLGVMMQCIFLMGLMTVIWGLYGYSLSFGGDDRRADVQSVHRQRRLPVHAETCEPDLATPRAKSSRRARWRGDHSACSTHMLFQGMFFIITPALICGAFAERMKFSTMVVFMILWGTLVYCPLCHWVWDGGILAYGSRHASEYACGGALDFAGGTVVHISSGVSALICALVLGKRLGFGTSRCRRTT